MSWKPVTLVYAIGFCFAMLGPNSVNAQRVEGRVDASPGQTHRAKEVLGSKVSIDGNVSIGKVDDIIFDDDGVIEYLIVDNDGKLVTVPWEAAKFNFQERTASVKITTEQFRRIPTYTMDKYPVFSTPNYRTETYKYYGVTPRERRLERRLDRKD